MTDHDDGVREIHGGTMGAGTQEKPLLVLERDDGVWLQKSYDIFKLTPGSARYLAKKLVHVADRVERRLGAIPSSPSNFTLTPEQRSERSRKAAATRRAKASGIAARSDETLAAQPERQERDPEGDAHD